MRIHSVERAGEGFMVTVEFPGAYTDGGSRFERVAVPAAAVRGRGIAQLRQAVWEAMEDPLSALVGEEVSAPTPTREIWEERSERTLERWKRWQWRIDHIAEYPGYASLSAAQKTALLNVLTNQRDAAAQADWDVLQAWRSAT